MLQCHFQFIWKTFFVELEHTNKTAVKTRALAFDYMLRYKVLAIMRYKL